jgi:membrane protein YdbS with pleckstrin-like domain
MVDWESAGRQSELKMWRVMFWIHVTLLLLAIVSVLLVIYGADANTSVWVFVPSIAVLLLVIIMLPFTYKKWRELRPNQKA